MFSVVLVQLPALKPISHGGGSFFSGPAGPTRVEDFFLLFFH